MSDKHQEATQRCYDLVCAVLTAEGLVIDDNYDDYINRDMVIDYDRVTARLCDEIGITGRISLVYDKKLTDDGKETNQPNLVHMPPDGHPMQS